MKTKRMDTQSQLGLKPRSPTARIYYMLETEGIYVMALLLCLLQVWWTSIAYFSP